MRYVRTKNSIREIIDDCGNCCSVKSNHRKTIDGFTIIYGLSFAQRADTIEELCDEFVVVTSLEKRHILSKVGENNTKRFALQLGDDVFGAIWTDKGLIYVAKMNEKGELELL